MNIIYKVFFMIMGVFLLVSVLGILNRVGDISCEPTDLFNRIDNPVAGFGGNFVNSLYDSICSSFVNANNGVWGAYSSFITGIIGQRGNLALISADLWGLASFFCSTHSNYEFATGDANGAITSTEDFKDLFVYEVERCWTIFEGENTDTPLSRRHPLGKKAFFDCAEIIYDFSDNINSVSFAELYVRLAGDNFCGNDVNSPSSFFRFPSEISGITEENSELSESIMWCAPQELMEEYWFDDDNEFILPESYSFSGNSVDSLTCNKGSNNMRSEGTSVDSSACLSFESALCSFSEMNTYYDKVSSGYPNGLIHRYNMNDREMLVDSVSDSDFELGIDCSFSGCDFYENGVEGSAVEFDKSGENNDIYIIKDNDKVLNFSSNSFSYSVWVLVEPSASISSSRGFIINNYDDYTNSEEEHGYTLGVDSSFIPVASMGLGTAHGFSIFANSAINDGSWHNIIVSVDRSGLFSLYLDGVLQTSIDISSYSQELEINRNKDLWGRVDNTIGGRSENGFTFPGAIDEILFFNRSLTQDDVTRIFEYPSVQDFSDESSAISGCGRVVVSYFDYFNWGVFSSQQELQDDYTTCSVNVINNFRDINLGDDYYRRRNQNAIVICYEKYGDGGDCDWIN